MSNTNAMLDLSSGGTYTLNISMREDGLRLDKLLLVTDTATIPSGQGPLESPTITDLPNLSSHTIQYNYDPFYRLTNANYTDNITATYSYVYDPVDNMTAYTETIDANTNSVNRTFNFANQLQTAVDTETGTSSFYYDGAGNLVEIMPPGATGQAPAGTIRYGFDQRNLLITSTLHISGTGWVDQVEYIYDGNSNRVQQIDYTSSQPITTTYHNDNRGLSQALIANNGITSTVNLFGLDLIHQNDGT